MKGDSIHILLVEDNPGDARLLQLALAKVDSLRVEFSHVQRLDHALECLAHQHPDVILLDLSLPDAQGFDTFARIHASASRVPIIALTGVDDEVLAIKAVREGAQDYLVKGQVDSNLLVRAMRYAIERKRAEERIKASLREKEVLLKEIHHRVKNNLQIISSLLNLQSQNLKDKEAFDILRDTQHRIRSMALIHEKLYQSADLARVDLAGYIGSLVDHLSCSYDASGRGIDVQIRVDDISVGVDTAVPCGLILSELVSNSFKHAFPNGQGGAIRIQLAAHDDHRVTLRVGDDGIGLPPGLDFRGTTTLGLQLINALVSQLDGEIRVNDQRGTDVAVTFVEPA